MSPGQIIILNGAPRSGKSSIVEAIQEQFDGVWMNLGVDVHARHITPPGLQPGIGLRPGGERPDLVPLVQTLYAALYESIAAHSRLGLNVAVDVGHHDLPILKDCLRRLEGLPVLLVGVRCPIEVILERRRSSPQGSYLSASPEEPVPLPVMRWQQEVHSPGIYDVEVDTSAATPEECAERIRQRLQAGPQTPTALQRILRLV